uniref:NLR family CARD domain-containing protein 3-like n=1 Tax=Fundulus heteroclitus TaxID=8078 RepID=A0A3Q2NWT6_FUNHE
METWNQATAGWRRMEELRTGRDWMRDKMEEPLEEKQQDSEETLLSFRAEFVKRVSEEVLKQLLDSLEAGGVLNNSETEAILEKNQTRADKARSTIDAVRKKGNDSCKMMIQHLQLKDATLSNHLGLSFAFSAQPGKATQFCDAAVTAKLTVFKGLYRNIS